MFIANLSCLIRMKISGLGLIKLNVHVVSNSAGIIRVSDSANESPALGQLDQSEARIVGSIRRVSVIWKRDNAARQNWLSGCLVSEAGGNCNSMSIGLRSMGTLCHIRSGISDKLMNWAGSYNTD